MPKKDAKHDIKNKNDIAHILMTLKGFYKGKTMLASFTDKTPFQILIATALSARTNVAAVIQISGELFSRYPDADSLAKADAREIEKIIKITGFFHTKARRIIDIAKTIVHEFGGEVPDDIQGLTSLPGVGRKTAGCVMVYAFDKDAIPVDTHVHRLANRLGWTNTNSPEKTEKELEKIVQKKHWKLVNEALVLHGQNICTPISPFCSRCPIQKHCPRIGVVKNR